ncbi:MAG: cofactor-independent phosphoglycerate mutase [Chitinispirillia bacterium]|jgi:2,3-bisphosphoglycerate-independent phosphoglycerate mutase
MKYIIILGDGMSDHPIEKLGNRTPLMVADTPEIDRLCSKGRCGKLITIPDDMPAGSEVANLSVMGYDVHKVYQGRGVLEAASLKIELDDTDLAMRCNLICIENGVVKNHSAGHITTEESHQIIDTLNNKLGSDNMKFYPGVSYRHVFVFKGGVSNLKCIPPHDVPGTPFEEVLIQPYGENGNETAEVLNGLILKSHEILKNHPVNKKRIADGKDPANSIWFWSPGHRPVMKTIQESFGINGAVISAVDLIQGIGVYAGMKVIKVEGATGLYDTNYEGKAEAVVNALRDYDFVYLHIEASDEAGHEGDVDLKIKTIEYLDKRVVKYIVEKTTAMSEDVAIAILPDHATPCTVRTHTRDAVPFLIYHPGETPDEVAKYNEMSTENGYYGLIKGDQFIKSLLWIVK